MNTTSGFQQRGAVVILVAFVLVALIGFGGLVIDLGRLYVAKTELQNAADAAALAGAKYLDGTLLGVQKAVHGTNNNDTANGAIYTAGLHHYDFTSKPVSISIANISVGDCPQDGCMVPASSITSNALAAGKTFLKVDTGATGSQTFNTFLIQVLGIFTSEPVTSTSTYGLAVAGRYTINVAPLAVCAINRSNLRVNDSETGELIELGFRRGIAYNIFELNPISNGDPIWINPIDSPPTTCNSNNNDAPTLIPFLCTGRTALNMSNLPVTQLPSNQYIYVNTGLGGATHSQEALNSRFGDPAPKCDVGTAPPDGNIRSYDCIDPAGKQCALKTTAPGLPYTWMGDGATQTMPSQQGVAIDATTHLPFDVNAAGIQQPVAQRIFSKYGPLWSYAWARDGSAGSDFNPTSSNWANLYGSGAAIVKPPYPATTPYAQTSGNYFLGPVGTGVPNRRVLNLAIVDCSGSIGKGSCKKVNVLGVGKFLMTTRAVIGGGKCSPVNGISSCLYAEFGGLLTPMPPTVDIKLYR